MRTLPAITEFRIVFPVTLEELKIATQYTACTVALAETGGGEGIEWLENEERVNEHGEEEVFVHKVLHLADKLPSVIRMVAPRGSLQVHEKTCNNFPYCKTEYTNPEFMKDDFSHSVETRILGQDKGNESNIFGLARDRLSHRNVVHIDFVNDPLDPHDYCAETDPTKIRLHKLERAPLKADWKDTETHYVCIYKLVETQFKWWGLQSTVQNRIRKYMHRNLHRFYRTLYSNLDNCHGMTIDDIRLMEDQTKDELGKLRTTGKVRGMAV